MSLTQNINFENRAKSAQKLNINYLKKIMCFALWLVGGIFAGRLCLLDGMYIGGQSYLVASALGSSLLPAFIGTIIGRMSMGLESVAPFELIPEILCFTTFFILHIIRYKPKKRIYVILAIVSRLPLLALTNFLLYDFIHFFMSTTLMIGCTASFVIAYEAIGKQDIKNNIVLIVASVALIISGMPTVEIYNVSLFMVLASITVTLTAAALGSAQAGAAGAMIGLSLALSGNGSFETGGILAICGLIAGILYDYGKYVVIPVFGASCLAICLLYTKDLYYIASWQTLLLAALVCVFVPSEKILMLRKQVSQQEKIQRWRSIEGVSKKILQLAKCLESLKNVFDDISIDDTTMLKDTAPIMQEINQRGCMGCEKEKVCWEEKLYDTYRAIGNIVSDWDEKTPPNLNKIPTSFIKNCCNKEKLNEAINTTYNLYVMKSNVNKKIYESKSLIKNHLLGGSQILEQMSTDISHNLLSTQDKVYKMLSDLENIMYPINEKDGEYKIKCKSCGGMGKCHVFAKKISKATDIQHSIKFRRCGNSNTLCSVCVAPIKGLEVFYGAAQKAKSGTLCGDAFVMTSLSSGAHLIAVADGMGSGPRASLEAKSAIELLKVFLNTGFDENTVFSIINKALMLRSGTETFAALDACIINPVDRYYRFLKVGAPPSYIYRQGDFIKIQSPSIPLGILENADCACIKREAYPGDVVILGSDGFEPSTLDESYFTKNIPINKLPRILLNNNQIKMPDDVTIVTAKIKSPATYGRRKAKLDDWKMRVANGI